MFIEKFLQLRNFCFCLSYGVWVIGYRMAWHGYSERMASCILFPKISAVRTYCKGRRLTIPGKILFRLAAAHSALGFPPSKQSSNSNKGWRTGLEKETLAESTKVIVRTPHPYKTN